MSPGGLGFTRPGLRAAATASSLLRPGGSAGLQGGRQVQRCSCHCHEGRTSSGTGQIWERPPERKRVAVGHRRGGRVPRRFGGPPGGGAAAARVRAVTQRLPGAQCAFASRTMACRGTWQKQNRGRPTCSCFGEEAHVPPPQLPPPCSGRCACGGGREGCCACAGRLRRSSRTVGTFVPFAGCRQPAVRVSTKYIQMIALCVAPARTATAGHVAHAACVPRRVLMPGGAAGGAGGGEGGRPGRGFLARHAGRGPRADGRCRRRRNPLLRRASHRRAPPPPPTPGQRALPIS